MATLKPFRILHPTGETAPRVCTLPYDVMNTDEARDMAGDNPDSFLRVTRAEIELDKDANPYEDSVYELGAKNLQRLMETKALVREDEPAYMIYRLTRGTHTQTGIVAAASCAEYDQGIVKKHELTRPDKEDDRTRHIEILKAQTGPVFLIYPQSDNVAVLVESVTEATPDINFTAEDGIIHTAWLVRDVRLVGDIETAFEQIPALYIADGHHRSAAAARVARAREGSSKTAAGLFLTVSFPSDQVKILPYNRVVKDLAGLSEDEFLSKLREVATVTSLETATEPNEKGSCSMYLAGKWYSLKFQPTNDAQESFVNKLDVAILQNRVLTPLLNIGDPRTDKRIQFVGGIRGTKELEKLVDSNDWAVAFAMHPTGVEELIGIADEDGLMPPKSTWFEPKLRDAMAVHLID